MDSAFFKMFRIYFYGAIIIPWSLGGFSLLGDILKIDIFMVFVYLFFLYGIGKAIWILEDL